MKHLIICLVAAATSSAAFAESEQVQYRSDLNIIPVPEHTEIHDRTYSLTDGGTFFIKGETVFLSDYLENCGLGVHSAGKPGDCDILISTGDRGFASDEAYSLEIRPDRIRIKSGGEAGAFYAVQSLLQMTHDGTVRELQCCIVNDSPRFRYRGLHFDVSRHFRSKEFLMKQIDAMALLKMNRMHLHLTDGAGWRIEIPRYPRLTEFAAWRPYRKWTDWSANGAEYCEHDTPGAYGGYYTADDIRQIVDYAAARHIDVIPEIEMPGHSEEVIAAYPELGCQGAEVKGHDFCPGSEATFEFLENVLSDVMDIFPSEYIHIGGDEAGKAAWHTCPACTARMKDEGLENVDELQSYLIHRIETFINSRGRKMIGWDEIIQGGLAPNATVMSWRGTEGGIKAIKSGHDVIMTPGASCYLDYTQDAPFKEPVSIGGYTPLEKVYSYEPVEPSLTEEESAHLLGVQGNLWTEYITEDSHAEYMYYPRAFAIAETGWSLPKNKDYSDFRRRALELTEMFRAKGYSTFDLAGEFGERKESLSPIRHKAAGKKVTYAIPYRQQYKAAGDITLTDGVAGGWTYGDNKWQGFMSDVDVTIDLGEIQSISYVGATFMHSQGAWVHVPQKVSVYLSEDGENFTLAGEAWCDIPDNAPELLFKQYSVICNAEARYVRFHAVRNQRPGCWLFTDEVVVN